MFDQVRAFGSAALQTLLKSGASASGTPASQRDVPSETSRAFDVLRSLLPKNLTIVDPALPNGTHSVRHAMLDTSMNFQASIVADLVYARKFEDQDVWNRCVGVYMELWMGKVEGLAFAQAVRSHYLAVDKVGHLTRFLHMTSD